MINTTCFPLQPSRTGLLYLLADFGITSTTGTIDTQDSNFSGQFLRQIFDTNFYPASST